MLGAFDSFYTKLVVYQWNNYIRQARKSAWKWESSSLVCNHPFQNYKFFQSSHIGWITVVAVVPGVGTNFTQKKVIKQSETGILSFTCKSKWVLP